MNGGRKERQEERKYQTTKRRERGIGELRRRGTRRGEREGGREEASGGGGVRRGKGGPKMWRTGERRRGRNEKRRGRRDPEKGRETRGGQKGGGKRGDEEAGAIETARGIDSAPGLGEGTWDENLKEKRGKATGRRGESIMKEKTLKRGERG